MTRRPVCALLLMAALAGCARGTSDERAVPPPVDPAQYAKEHQAWRDEQRAGLSYSGYRIVSPKVVQDGEWTVLDFNFALNPPCAYSKFTTCPLPPPENRLATAVEAGLKRLPSAQGY